MALQSVAISIPREQVLGLLEKRAMRGKLAGFELEHEGFRCAAFGDPFDSDLVARFDNGELLFVLRRKLMMPIVAWALIIFAIWPGAWMMHSLMDTYFSSYPWFFGGLWWQLIFAVLTATAIPVLLKQHRKSAVATREHAEETIEKIRRWLCSAGA